MHARKLSSILAALALSIAVVTAGASGTFAKEGKTTTLKAVHQENKQIVKKTAAQTMKNKKDGQIQKLIVNSDKRSGTISKKTAKNKKKDIKQNTRQENKAVEKQNKQLRKANSAKLTPGQKYGHVVLTPTRTRTPVKFLNKGLRGIPGVRRVEDQNASGIRKEKKVFKIITSPGAAVAKRGVNKSNMSDKAKARTDAAINDAVRAKKVIRLFE